MKHPLTSKERRGLAAVAAAALLCIAMGFIFRNCKPSHGSGKETAVVIVQKDSLNVDEDIRLRNNKTRNSSKKKSKSVSGKSKKGSGEKKKKAEKSYPVRDPLSQPCD